MRSRDMLRTGRAMKKRHAKRSARAGKPRPLRCESLEHRRLLTTMSLEFSTFLGGQKSDRIFAVDVDENDFIYVSGDFSSKGFPSTLGSNPKGNKTNSFAAKFNAVGQPEWINSLGLGESTRLAIDTSGNTYVPGTTVDAGFLGGLGGGGGFDTAHNGSQDVYVLKLDSFGIAVAGSFLGGIGVEVPTDIAVDDSGHVYITGYTDSVDFPTNSTNPALDGFHNGGQDGFAVKLSADLSTLAYSTYLGGGDVDRSDAVSVDALGNAYIAGRTLSGDFFSSSNSFGSGGGQDVFVTKLNTTGGKEYSAILGGESIDGFEQITYVHAGVGIAVDADGSAYVTGMTDATGNPSTDFPTTLGALYETHQGGCGCGFNNRDQDAFVTKINPAGDGLVYSTFLGGSANEHSTDLMLDDEGNAYLTGSTFGGVGTFPTTSGTFNEDGSGNEENQQSAFLTVIDSAGASLIDSTYLGSTESDHGDAISLDASSNIYVVGRTTSAGFPTSAGAFDEEYSGSSDGFITKFSLAPTTPGITVSPTSGLVTDEGGASDSFTVVLKTEPMDNVTIDLSSDNVDEGLVSSLAQGSTPAQEPATSIFLTFTPADWDAPQTVTVTGVDDVLVDGNVSYAIISAPTISMDPNYAGLIADAVLVTNLDNEPLTALTITSIAPATMAAGSTIDVSIEGTGFSAGATITFVNGAGPAPAASNVIVVDPTTITATLSVSQGGPKGSRLWDVVVTNLDSSTDTLFDGFEVFK